VANGGASRKTGARDPKVRASDWDALNVERRHRGTLAAPLHSASPSLPPFPSRSFVRAGCVDGNSTFAWPGMHADLKHQSPTVVPVSNLVDGASTGMHDSKSRPSSENPQFAVRCEFMRVIPPKAKMISRFKENGRTRLPFEPRFERDERLNERL